MANRIGLLGKLYRGAPGSVATTLVNNVKDLTTNGDRTEGDISNRGSQMELVLGTMIKHDLGFKMNLNEADVDYQAFRDAWLNNTPIAAMALSNSAGEGWDADYVVTKFVRTEPLKGIMEVDVMLKPTYSTRYPVWHSST